MYVLLRFPRHSNGVPEFGVSEIVGPFNHEANAWDWADKHWPTLDGHELDVRTLSSPHVI